jgi:ribosomal protein L35AE/L33A
MSVKVRERTDKTTGKAKVVRPHGLNGQRKAKFFERIEAGKAFADVRS